MMLLPGVEVLVSLIKAECELATASPYPAISLELFGNEFSADAEKLLHEALETPILAGIARRLDVSFAPPVTK
jgi:hypothetical protein